MTSRLDPTYTKKIHYERTHAKSLVAYQYGIFNLLLKLQLRLRNSKRRTPLNTKYPITYMTLLVFGLDRNPCRPLFETPDDSRYGNRRYQAFVNCAYKIAHTQQAINKMEAAKTFTRSSTSASTIVVIILQAVLVPLPVILMMSIMHSHQILWIYHVSHRRK